MAGYGRFSIRPFRAIVLLMQGRMRSPDRVVGASRLMPIVCVASSLASAVAGSSAQPNQLNGQHEIVGVGHFWASPQKRRRPSPCLCEGSWPRSPRSSAQADPLVRAFLVQLLTTECQPMPCHALRLVPSCKGSNGKGPTEADIGRGPVKTCTSEERAALLSLLFSPRSGSQCFYFLD